MFTFEVSQFIGDDKEKLQTNKFALTIKAENNVRWIEMKMDKKEIHIEIERIQGYNYEYIIIKAIQLNTITLNNFIIDKNTDKYHTGHIFMEELKESIHRFLLRNEVAYHNYEKTFFDVDDMMKHALVIREDNYEINDFITSNNRSVTIEEMKLFKELNKNSFEKIKKDCFIKHFTKNLKNPMSIVILSLPIVGSIIKLMGNQTQGNIVTMIGLILLFLISLIEFKKIYIEVQNINKNKNMLEKENLGEKGIKEYQHFRKNLNNILKI